jgi:DNA-binding LytR/AlgR family response regulator
MREKTETSREATASAFGEARTPTFLSAFSGPNSKRVYAISLTVGVLLAVTGAFYDAAIPVWIRLAFWLPVMVIGASLGQLTSAYVITIERWAKSQLLAWGLLTLFVGAPMSLVVWLASSMAFQGFLDFKQITLFAPGTFLISAVMATIFTFMHQTPSQTYAAGAATQAPPRFLERLPFKLRGASVYAVSAEDHYLRLYTSRGSDMILLRLSDAIAELDGIEGSQVHRSWWVARDAVESVVRGEGKAVFTLKGGTQVPVSRTFAKALREAGWY